MEAVQRRLADEQVAAFYTDALTADQVEHFIDLTKNTPIQGKVVDMGGGCGHFARQLQQATDLSVRVIDADQTSIRACRAASVEAHIGDALAPEVVGDEAVASFNLILHHLVGDSESVTREMQKRALTAWNGRAPYIFVNEYVYDSFVGDASGRLIYAITSSRMLSAAARFVSRYVPSLRANTLGVGVRFRSRAAWLKLFKECGLDVVGVKDGSYEHLPLPRRVLLIRAKRRDSFLLKTNPNAQATIGTGWSDVEDVRAILEQAPVQVKERRGLLRSVFEVSGSPHAVDALRADLAEWREERWSPR